MRAPGLQCGTSTAGGQLANLCGNPLPCGTESCDADSFCYENPTGSFRCVRHLGLGEKCPHSDSRTDQRCGPSLECGDEGSCIIGRNRVELGDPCSNDSFYTSCRIPHLCEAGRCVRFDPALCHARKDAGSGRDEPASREAPPKKQNARVRVSLRATGVL